VRKPRQYLKPGDVIRSKITGLGEMENPCRQSPIWG
jgi:2-keto-4-pentenoate hydratase/2-oxohepta-3-ene-1,7-dioic acid hydratase in catechol pathway